MQAPNIRSLRRAKGVSQEQLADLCGVSLLQIGYWETGRDLTLADAAAIADALDVSIDDLVGREVRDLDDEALERLYNSLSSEGKARLVEYVELLLAAGFGKEG